jgi:hypothetical protein
VSHTDNILLILDDREFTGEELRGIVGTRHFGDIIFKRRLLAEHFYSALPHWAQTRFIHLRTEDDLAKLWAIITNSPEGCSACLIAARAGFPEPERLTQFLERLPYAEEDFTDRLYKPLVVFLSNAHRLIEYWEAFRAAPMHNWESAWQQSQRLQSVTPLDLGRIHDFLFFTCGSTSPRHFNEISSDTWCYTKKSNNIHKIHSEYCFASLVPEKMRPWLIQPFDYLEENGSASYKMMRYYLADAALQWVHGAFTAESFQAFVERLLFFIAERPRQRCEKQLSLASAEDLFVSKPASRVGKLLSTEAGRRVNALAESASDNLDIRCLLERYLALYRRHEKDFVFDSLAIGHGDHCFSNILYDQQRHLLILIDPKGALREEELWTHPLYDLCKISHSALGDYDFINNGQYSVNFSNTNALSLHCKFGNHAELKKLFMDYVIKMGHNPRVMRLGEASLFLSMLPLHIDYPNKVLAFMLKAKEILDEVEHG